MNRKTGELTLVQKVPVPGAEKTSLVSLPMALSPDKRFIYAQLRSEPYPVSTFAINNTDGKLIHLRTTPLVDQMAYINVEKTGKHLLSASYTGAKVAVYPIDARHGVTEKATQIIDTKPKAQCVFIDASNKDVYVPVLGADHVMQLSLTPILECLRRTIHPPSLLRAAPAHGILRSTRTASGVISSQR